jgi:hypothetical protein
VAPQKQKANLRKSLNFNRIQGFLLLKDRQKSVVLGNKKSKTGGTWKPILKVPPE